MADRMYHPNGPPNPNDKMYQMYLENQNFHQAPGPGAYGAPPGAPFYNQQGYAQPAPSYPQYPPANYDAPPRPMPGAYQSAHYPAADPYYPPPQPRCDFPPE